MAITKDNWRQYHVICALKDTFAQHRQHSKPCAYAYASDWTTVGNRSPIGNTSLTITTICDRFHAKSVFWIFRQLSLKWFCLYRVYTVVNEEWDERLIRVIIESIELIYEMPWLTLSSDLICYVDIRKCNACGNQF